MSFIISFINLFQVKAKITQVQEHQRQMNDFIALAESAITSGDASTVPDTSLNFQPEFRDPSYTKLVNGFQVKIFCIKCFYLSSFIYVYGVDSVNFP